MKMPAWRSVVGFIALAVLAAASASAVGAEAAPPLLQSGPLAIDNGLTRPGPPTWKKAYTEHVGKLVGTRLSPYPPGYVGGDMGVSFPVGDQIFFTAGDLASSPWTATFYDALAATDARRLAGALPQLRWVTDRAPFLTPPGVDYGCNNGPFEGFQYGDKTYLFYATDWIGQCPKGTDHRTLALVHANGGDFTHLVTDWKAHLAKFQMVSVVREGDTLWIFASGHSRASSVYLAKASLTPAPGKPFLHPSAWRFYDGHGGFTDIEAAAQPVVQDSCVGELSVRRHPELGIWLMTSANCADRGFVLRTAASPTGPWSNPYDNNAGVIWDLNHPGPHDDPGYGSFLHTNNRIVGFDDGLSDYGQEPVWGGEYGSQMIPQYFTRDAPGVYSLYYVSSSWNPYVYHLMRTVMVEDGYPVPEPQEKGAGLPPPVLANADFAAGASGWTQTGQPPRIANGRATVLANSSISQAFTLDSSTHQLSFHVSGDAGGKNLAGHWKISAMLVQVGAGEVVRRTWPVFVPLGKNGNPLPPVAGSQDVRWNLDAFRGERVRLVVENAEDVGAITVWAFRFEGQKSGNCVGQDSRPPCVRGETRCPPIPQISPHLGGCTGTLCQ
ncbi:MAG: DUF4185 domain-containing protein [Caulobacterales bacterium]